MTRRDLLKLLLASAVAEAADVERLLWVPKPIVTVPGLMGWDMGAPGADAWVLGVRRRGEITFVINFCDELSSPLDKIRQQLIGGMKCH